MRYISTARQAPPARLMEAVASGFAPDGGLYMPDRVPALPRAFFNNITEMPARDMAYVVARQLFDEVDHALIKHVARETFSFQIPLKRLDDNTSIMELYHGPTHSYNDIGAEFMGGLLRRSPLGSPITFIMATMGDPGAAVARALADIPGVRAVILFPQGRLSAPQRARLSAVAPNILPVEIEGTIDNCRYMANRALTDPVLNSQIVTSSANAANPARFMPHVLYFFQAYSLLRAGGERRPMTIALPAGNLASLSAAVLARQMGLPVKRIIVGTNANDTLVNLLNTGKFEPRATQTTCATALDTGNPSNLPRLLFLEPEPANLITAEASSDTQILETLTDSAAKGHIIDPATAAALRAVRAHARPAEEAVVLMANADPANTPEVLRRAGVSIPSSPSRAPMPKRPARIPPRYQTLKQLILSTQP